MGTKYYRFDCFFIGEMSIVHPSYPVRAAKPSPAKRFAVAALTAVPNPKYRIYDGGGTIYVCNFCPLHFSRTCQSKTRSKGEPWAKGDAATSEACGGAASADQVLHLAVQLNYFWHLQICKQEGTVFFHQYALHIMQWWSRMTHSCRKVTHYDDMQKKRLSWMTTRYNSRKFVWNNNMQIDFQERQNANRKESNNANCAKMTLQLQIAKRNAW